MDVSQPEVIDGLEDALNQRLEALLPPQQNRQRNSLRTDNPDWFVEELNPREGTGWLVYRAAGLFPHDVIVRVYELPTGRSLIRAWSRSRVGLFDYRRNQRILRELNVLLQQYWANRGYAAVPAGGVVAPVESP